MAPPIGYNLRSLFVRRTATLMAAAGVACVVAVFIVVTSLAEGFRLAVGTSGSPRNALLIRKGSQAELQSNLDPGLVDLVRSLPHAATGEDGRPLAFGDTVMVMSLAKREGGGEANVTLRGLDRRSLPLRERFRLLSGRLFEPGSAELIVGRGIAGRVKGLEVGGSFRQRGREWRIVGLFEADGSGFESEVWGDVDAILGSMNLRVYQSVTLRLRDAASLDALKALAARDLRLNSLEVRREDLYYAAQSEPVTTALSRLAMIVTVVMSIGAVVGAMNTMYAAVASRTREIGTLRAIGFGPGAIFLGFLAESLCLCALGTAAGAALSLLADGIATGTTNFSSFSEVAFRFRVTPRVVLEGAIFGLAMGLVGGALPALRAARLRVVRALRRG